MSERGGRRSFGSVRQLASGRWQARYRDDAGSLQSAPRTFASKGDASRWLATAEADQARGEWLDPRLGATRFDAFVDEWWPTTAHLRPTTRASYEYLLRVHLRPTFGGTPIWAHHAGDGAGVARRLARVGPGAELGGQGLPSPRPGDGRGRPRPVHRALTVHGTRRRHRRGARDAFRNRRPGRRHCRARSRTRPRADLRRCVLVASPR